MSFSRKFQFEAVGMVVAVVLAAVVLGGCSGKEINSNDPEALYKDAEEEISGDHYQMAIEKLKIVKNKFPYSKYSVDAALRIADVYFLQESYAEAAAAYEAFRDLHPKHEKTAYAMFRIGKSYYNDIPDPHSRDLTPATKALDAFEEFLKRYPTAPEAEEAQKSVAQIRAILAEKELYIGNFYFKRDFLYSAKPRYQKIIDLYPETEAANEAKSRLARIAEIAIKDPSVLIPPEPAQPSNPH